MVPSVAANYHPQVYTVNQQRTLTLYAEVDGGGDPYLETNGTQAVENGPLTYDPDGSPTANPTSLLSGINSAVKGIQGEPSGDPIIELETKEPVPQTLYLNLSASITGNLYWTSTAYANGKEEIALVRAEVFAGAKRLGGAEGATLFNPTGAVTASSGYVNQGLVMIPEVAKVEKGEKIRMRITKLAGLTDFVLGTGGNHQTQFTLSYFDQDPLKGTAYLKGRTLLELEEEPESPEDRAALRAHMESEDFKSQPPRLIHLRIDRPADASSLALFGWASMPVAALLSLRRPPLARARTTLVVLGLMIVALSGCLGGSGPLGLGGKPGGGTNGPPEPTNSTVDPFEYTPSKRLGRLQVGAIQGVVRNWLGLPIENVNISLLGTTEYTLTSSRGAFGFDNLTEGTKGLFLDTEDAEGVASWYQSLELLEIPVRIGFITWVNVTLARQKWIGFEHRHDLWGGATRLKMFEKFEFTPPNTIQKDDVWICTEQLDGVSGTEPYRKSCLFPIPLPYDRTEFGGAETKRVLSGATRIEVYVNWSMEETPYGSPPREMMLRMNDNRFVARPSGEPFSYAFYPNLADPGHQSFTSWTFSLEAPTAPLFTWNNLVFMEPTAAAYPYAYAVKGPIEVEMWVYKGVVPLEPVHPDMWNGNTSIELIPPNKQQKNITSNNPLSPYDFPAACNKYPQFTWVLDDIYGYDKGGPMVPFDAKEIRGVLKWEPTGALPADTVWNVIFHPANAPPAANVWYNATMEPDGPNQRSFRIPLQGHDAELQVDRKEWPDQPYQPNSYWKFCVSNDVAALVNAGGVTYTQEIGTGVSLTLDATVYKDTEGEA